MFSSISAQNDCSANKCNAALGWLVSNSKYMGYVNGALTCSNGTAVSSLNYLLCQCPDLSSLPSCDCHITTSNDGFFFRPSGNYLTVACGKASATSKGTMNDNDAFALVGLLSPTTPVEAIGIYYQNLNQIPKDLKQFPFLVAVSLQGNAITSADAADLTWPLLREIYLDHNAIASLSGDFALSHPYQTNGGGHVRFDVRYNAISDISTATFTLSADTVFLSFFNNSITSANGDTFTLSATQFIYFDFGYNQIGSVSGKFNLTATNSTNGKVQFYLNFNRLTTLSPATFYLNGPSYAYLALSSNALTSVTAASITLEGSRRIVLSLTKNQLTSVQLAPDTNPPLTTGQELYLANNNLTLVDCNDLGINSGALTYFFDASKNQISEAKCGAGTPLDDAQLVVMDWSSNSFTSLPAGSFNFAGAVAYLGLNDQKTAFTSISPEALPSELLT